MITYSCDICKQPVRNWYQVNRETRQRPDMDGIPSDAMRMTNRSRMICCDCMDKIEDFIRDLQREATVNE